MSRLKNTDNLSMESIAEQHLYLTKDMEPTKPRQLRTSPAYWGTETCAILDLIMGKLKLGDYSRTNFFLDADNSLWYFDCDLNEERCQWFRITPLIKK